MKRSIITIPLFTLLAACGTSSGIVFPKTDLVLACPSGAPAAALYKYVANEGVDIDVNSNPKNVLAYLSAESGKDVVVAPTHGGLKAIKGGAPFKIAATLTFGNFYLASTGNDDDATLDADDYVVAFQENDVPGKIFKATFPEFTNVHFLAGDKAAQDAAAALLTGKHDGNDVDYVYLAEPALTTVLGKRKAQGKPESTVVSVQERFKEGHDGKMITQASLFVRSSVAKEKVDSFLSDVKQGVKEFVEEGKSVAPYVASLSDTEVAAKFNASVTDLEEMTKNGNRMGLGYQSAYDIKADIESFVSLFGITGLDEEVYYR